MTTRLTDEIVRAAQAGDPAALSVLWNELSPAVHGYLDVRGVPDAEGVTSEVFLALFRALPDLRGGAPGLRTLTFSIAHARVVDEARRKARRPREIEFDPAADPRTVPSAEDEAVHNETTRRVRAWLDELAPDHRDVLTLRYLAELSLEDTAATLGRSVGAVKQLQRRALLALRTLTEGDSATSRITLTHSTQPPVEPSIETRLAR